MSFGSLAAPSFTVVDATTITAITPPRTSAGTVDVTVANYAGTGTLSAAFTYTSSPAIAFISPVAGPITGGTLVTITGTGFVTGAVVTFGGIPSSTVTFVNDTGVTATAPPKVAGAVDIGMRNPDGQTATLTGAYTYTSGPAITKVTPAIGPLRGGAAITIQSTGFQPGATVFVGGQPATGIVVTSTSKIAAITPANTAGSATVSVNNPDGLAITAIGAFTYADPPAVTSVTPGVGPATGGTKITITGAGFAIGATVKVGGEAASVWYYDAASDLWTFFIPGFTPTAKGIGDLTTVPAALASLIVVTK